MSTFYLNTFIWFVYEKSNNMNVKIDLVLRKSVFWTSLHIFWAKISKTKTFENELILCQKIGVYHTANCVRICLVVVLSLEKRVKIHAIIGLKKSCFKKCPRRSKPRSEVDSWFIFVISINLNFSSTLILKYNGYNFGFVNLLYDSLCPYEFYINFI